MTRVLSALLVRALVRGLVVAPVAAAAVATTATPAAAEPSVVRVAGSNRVATSVQVARQGWSSADEVLIATSRDYPDAVAAAALAARRDAPVILTSPDGLPDAVRDVLRDLGTSHATVLGGWRAVSGEVDEDLRALGIDVSRIAGASRYETAGLIAQEASGGGSPVVALALGARPDGRDAWPDALSASSLAGLDIPVPTLLTAGDSLSGEAADAIRDLGAERVIILGGDAAISERVVEQVRQLGASPTRAHGPSRYGTAVDVAEHAMEGPHAETGSLDPTQAVFVSGADFPDALAAGALAARASAPLLLTPPDRLHDSVDAFLRAEDTTVTEAFIVGGERAVDPFVADELRAAMANQPRPTPPPACDPAYSSPDCTYTYEHPVETWERLARCESGGNWSINTGNGYYGGLQFSLGSWQAVGGKDYPHRNTKWEQIHRGELLQDRQGWGAWPSCSRKLGLR